MPIVIFVGILGNSSAICTIFFTKLRETPPNHYLAALTASDTVFLISLVPVWRGVYSHNGICQTFTYLLNVSSWISSWATTALTVERYFVIFYPLSMLAYCDVRKARLTFTYLLNVSSWISSWATTALTVERYFVIFYPLSMLAYCDVRKARLVILGIIPVPLFFNIWVFLTHEVYSETCTVVRYFKTSFTLSVLDSVLVFAAPSILLTVLNVAIVSKLLKDHVTEPQKPKGFCINYVTENSNDPFSETQLVIAESQQRQENLSARHHKHGNSQRRKITGILIAVPCIFVVLNLPYYVIRFRNYVMVGTSSSRPTIADLVANQVAAMLYFTNYAIDFFLYAFSSSNFRQAAFTMFRRRLFGNSPISETCSSSKTSERYKRSWRLNGRNSLGFFQKSLGRNNQKKNGDYSLAETYAQGRNKRRYTTSVELSVIQENGDVHKGTI